ncbi:hypothetical protein BFJ68_g17301 [Fusarium oxysporum]|jgi:hypothetical protein|uniref:Uncharacterized protein n=1 Tax=Fusarium oxysporum TaxID=5507 RepID=A0A420NYE8_FUSOX|nr:hypothetical protein FOMA001_g13817 [Fusarium oxysporum f. sp. matthiolae]KAJ0128895.1 Uncharacterized protein HZ326_28007 [Fusarium oxysporum f. sp. albedinis]KAJ0133036.1 GTP-binding protein rho2 [Fusarium oxysporum f. sp. albedinis]RKK85167.1 hypothetical protein BFJ68_g17301 [Fusarium oxysporum]
MKFVSLLVASLLPAGLMAAPVDGGGDISMVGAEPAPGTTAARDVGDEIFKRSTRVCTIVGGSATVNCRSGPGTQYGISDTVYRGNDYIFTCVKTGECIIIGGDQNWYVSLCAMMRDALAKLSEAVGTRLAAAT